MIVVVVGFFVALRLRRAVYLCDLSVIRGLASFTTNAGIAGAVVLLQPTPSVPTIVRHLPAHKLQ
jgi:hypothetical protein